MNAKKIFKNRYKMKQSGQCYMCDNSAISAEHVPPKCLFKKGSKRNLITVPSCDKHNSGKSEDDTYLQQILGHSHIEGDNNSQQKAVNDSISRGYKRNEKYRKDIVKDTFIVNGRVARVVDKKRLDNIFHHIFSGIFFHHYEKKWLKQCKFFYSFVGSTTESNRLYKEVPFTFEGYTEYGENKEIFKYQITSIEWLPVCSIQMVFFDGLKVIGYGKNH